MKSIYCAKAAIIDADNNLLVLRRSSTHPYQALMADLPGGVVEPGESFEAGVIREISEETGLSVTGSPMALVYAATAQEQPGESITRVLFVVRIATVKPEISISWEHDQYEWQPMHAVTAQFVGFYGEAVEYVQKHALWQDVS